MTASAVLQTELTAWPVRRGKVRDVYDLGDRLLFVATDRISAFDWILPTGIPDKGRILTAISEMWFRILNVPNHLLSTELDGLTLSAAEREMLAGRSMIVRKANVVPIECVARGYLAGSGWKEFASQGTVCGQQLPPGLRLADRLPEPIFTPASKAEAGHDENISFETMCRSIGSPLAERLRELTLQIYVRAADFAAQRGLILADTKFEFGTTADGEILLVDEVLTPDSSRYWAADLYRPGSSPPSFDKQFVRDWLERSGWDKNSSPPPLPDDVVTATRAKYLEAYQFLTGHASLDT